MGFACCGRILKKITQDMKSKYHSRKIMADGLVFDSNLELERWRVLRLAESRGTISNLRRQVPFVLLPKQTIKVRKVLKTKIKMVDRVAFREVVYVADFVYERNGAEVIEDTKGIILPMFRLKAALLMYFHGKSIKIVKHADEEI